MVLTGQIKEIEAAANVIVAEAKGDSWLQRSWRPLLMCLFGLIVANNYLVVPLFGTPVAEIPPDMLGTAQARRRRLRRRAQRREGRARVEGRRLTAPFSCAGASGPRAPRSLKGNHHDFILRQ